MSGIIVPQKKSLADKLNSIAKKSRASLLPEERKEKKEPEVVPDLREVVSSAPVRLKILRLTEAIHSWGVEEREAKKEKKRFVDQLKELFKDNGIDDPKFMAGELRVLQYEVPRSSINMQKLLEHNVSPKVIAACTDTRKSLTLKISLPGESEEEE